ncbi:MAG: DUF2974 domain-containing protein [Saccharofermentans sp.]|nr:DUF2974 domain-containing protein [Saccharofermentans sp.]
MDTFFEYLKWRGDLSFSKVAFNDVDAAIFARLSYMPFDGIVSSEYEFMNLREACNKAIVRSDFNYHAVNPKKDKEFLELIKKSKRFSELQITNFVYEVDEALEKQFGACIFKIVDGKYYLAYRGTDKVLIGWKEDLNMGVEFPVPAQTRALEYFEEAVNNLPEGEYIIGGHSKGGNLSVYSAAFCNSQCQDMIKMVYNFDGPGFSDEVVNRLEFKAVADKIHTFVPEFSVVGMLLEHAEDYTVVKSNEIGILQHEMYSWVVKPTSFSCKKTVKKTSLIIDGTMKEWLSRMNMEERAEFIDILYALLTGGQAHHLYDFKSFESYLGMFKVYRKMDFTTQIRFITFIIRLVKSAGINVGFNPGLLAEKVKSIGKRK